MRTILTIILFAFYVVNTAHAQKKRSIEESVIALTRAMESADEKILNELVADKLSYGHSNGRVEDKNSFVSSLATGTSDFVSINITDQTVSMSGNLALIRHKLSGAINDRGVPGNVNLFVLQVWQKQRGRWLLIARQATKLL